MVNPHQGEVVFADVPRSKHAAELYKSITGHTEWPILVSDAEGVLGRLSDEETAGKLRGALIASRPADALPASLPLGSSADLRVRILRQMDRQLKLRVAAARLLGAWRVCPFHELFVR